MKIFSKITTAAALSIAATGVTAQTMIDGSIGFQFISAPDDSHDYQTQIDGSVTFGLAQNISVQVDLGLIKYEDDGFSDLDYGIHLIYALNDAIDLGVFYSHENDEGAPWYDFFGVEAGYQNNGFDVEAHFTYETSAEDGSVYYILAAKAGYTFETQGSFVNSIMPYVGVSIEYDDAWAIGLDNLYAGVNIGLSNNLELNLRAASMDDDIYRYYTVGVTYNFGQGTRFAARDYTSEFPGY